MSHLRPIPQGSAPAPRVAVRTTRRSTAGLAFAIAVFFGASLVLVHRLTDPSPPPLPPPPALADAGPDAAHPGPATSRPPAASPEPARGGPASGLAQWPSRPAGVAPVPSAGAPRIDVSFKLDPRLTRGRGMGDRWISPPMSSSAAAAGGDVTLEARARARDSNGRQVKDATPVWTPADPEMLAVTPGERGTVRIRVRRSGRSDVSVRSGGAAKTLTFAAAQERGIWRIDVSQR